VRADPENSLPGRRPAGLRPCPGDGPESGETPVDGLWLPVYRAGPGSKSRVISGACRPANPGIRVARRSMSTTSAGRIRPPGTRTRAA